MNQDIEIYIEELVLHGFAPDDFKSIKDAVETELGRLLAERGVPASLSSARGYATINLGQFSAVPGQPLKVGGDIAQTLYNGLVNNKSQVKK